MTEAEIIKAQADLIAAQQNFISLMSGNTLTQTIEKSTPNNVLISNEKEGDQEKPKSITFYEYTQTFLKSRENTVKPSTYHSYVWMLNKTILPMIGDVEICKIDNRRLQDFADELFKTYAKKSVRDMVGLVKTILGDAYINDAAEPRKFMIKYPKSEKKDYKTLSEDEFRKFEEYLLSKNKPHDIGELIMLETGMRIGEACGLKWGDIDFNKRTIKIKRTVQRIYKTQEKTSEINVGGTKTSAGERTIPISEQISNYLKQNAMCDNIYIMSGRKEPMEPRTHRQYHERVMKKIGIDYINPHALRHTFATRAIQHGVDPKTVSAILGHSNSNITLNIYTSVTDEMLRNGIEKMNGKSQTEKV